MSFDYVMCDEGFFELFQTSIGFVDVIESNCRDPLHVNGVKICGFL